MQKRSQLSGVLREMRRFLHGPSKSFYPQTYPQERILAIPYSELCRFIETIDGREKGRISAHFRAIFAFFLLSTKPSFSLFDRGFPVQQKLLLVSEENTIDK